MVFVHRINCLLTASGRRLPVRGAEVGGCACSGAGSAPSKAGAAGRRGGAASLAACGGGRSSRFPAGLEQAQRPIVGAASELGQEFPAPQQRSTEPRPRASNVPLQLLQLPREPVGSGRLAVGAEPGRALGRPRLLRVRVPGGCSSGHGRLQQKAHATPPYHSPPHPCPASGPRRGDWCVLLFLRTPEEGGWMGREQCCRIKGQPRFTPGPALPWGWVPEEALVVGGVDRAVQPSGKGHGGGGLRGWPEGSHGSWRGESNSGAPHLSSGSCASGRSVLRARWILCEPNGSWAVSGRVSRLPCPPATSRPHLARVQPVLQPVGPSDARQRHVVADELAQRAEQGAGQAQAEQHEEPGEVADAHLQGLRQATTGASRSGRTPAEPGLAGH